MPAQTAAENTAGSAGALLDAQKLLDNICTNILPAYDQHDAVEQARKAASAEHQRNAVILVGEINRGKSQLANALVGVQGLTPVGADFTTVIPVALGPATEKVPAGSAALISGEGQVLCPAEELSQRVDRASQSEGDFLPTRAYVAVERSRMGDAVAIDAPGVGGISSMDSAVHADTEHQASVVVVVADASSPLTKPEMDFLKRAAAKSASVIVAVTKTDKNLTRWREIVEDNKDLIAEHVGHDIPVIGVSSLLPFVEGMGTSARGTDRIAGITELRRTIAAHFARAKMIPAANGLRIAAHHLEEIDAKVSEEIADLKNAGAALPELNESLETLKELKRTRAEWEQFLNRDLALTRKQALDSLDEQLEEVRVKWTEFIGKHGVQVLRKDPQHFTRVIEEDYQRVVAGVLAQFADDVAALVKDNFGSAATSEDVLNEIQQQLELGDMQSSELRRNTRDAFDPMILMLGFSGGSAIGGVLGATLIPGIGLVAGVSWIAVNFGFRAIKQGKTQLQNWLKETSNTAKTHTSRALESFQAVARPAIVLRYRRHLEEEIKATEQRIKEVEAAQKLEEQQRKRKIDTREKNRKVILRNHAEAEKLIARLTSEEVV